MWYQDILADPLLQVLLVILAVAVGWILLRFIFKIAMRIFMIGCVAIFVIGAILLILNYVSS
ncbi:MAG: hypothetical protein PVF83_07545 [Anaerolineales bacterium]|jgi:hypothetical protein